MEINYFVPDEDKDLLISDLGIDPFDGNLISEKTLQLYDSMGISIDDASVRVFVKDFREKFSTYVNPKQLRVHRVLNTDLNPLTSDFTILGFRKKSPSYERGRKTKSEYLCITTDEVIVEKTFNDSRDSHGILTGLEVQFKFYCEDGTIGATKTEVVKQYNKYEAETEERKRRYRQFDYLRGSVKGTPNESYIAIIINYFSESITKYQDDGILYLNEHMLNTLSMDISALSVEEQLTIGTVQAILQAPVERNDGEGMTTVIKSIQYQIGTIDLEDL